MTSIATTCSGVIRRCPFCKIDLKGRFVYANERLEDLLGVSQVDLFGHALAEFLDPGDHQVVREIMAQSSHFETSYDSASVMLVRPDGCRTPATIILSLNFRGGTPVNYEIIINPESNHTLDDDMLSQRETSRSLETILDADPDQPSVELAEALCRFTGAATVRFFEIGDDSGIIIAEAHHPGHSPDAGDGPSALIVEYPLVSTRPLSVQLTYPTPEGDDAAAALTHRAERAVELVNRAAPQTGQPHSDYKASQPAVDARAILDQIGFALLVFDDEGNVTAANDSAQAIFADAATFNDIIARLSGNNDAAVLEQLCTFRETALDVGSKQSHSMIVQLPDGRLMRLILCCPGRKDRDHGGYIIFDEQVAPGHAQDTEPALRYLTDSLVNVAASLKAADGLCEKLEHENHGELHGHGGFYLKSLRRQFGRIDDSLGDLTVTLELVRKDSGPETTDLNLLITRAFDEALAARSGGQVDLKVATLPKITADRQRLAALIRSFVFRLVAAGGSSIAVDSQQAGGCLTIRFETTCEPAVRSVLERELKGKLSPSQDVPQSSGGRILNLGVLPAIASLVGGQLSLTDSDKDRLVIELTIPDNTGVPQT